MKRGRISYTHLLIRVRIHEKPIWTAQKLMILCVDYEHLNYVCTYFQIMFTNTLNTLNVNASPTFTWIEKKTYFGFGRVSIIYIYFLCKCVCEMGKGNVRHIDVTMWPWSIEYVWSDDHIGIHIFTRNWI